MGDNEKGGGRELRKRSSEPGPWVNTTVRVSRWKYDELYLTLIPKFFFVYLF